jgi:two-component system OmpR family response regulator
LSRFLTRHGFRVTTGVDGRDMHKALNDQAIDLIVLDLMLPGEDGLSLCRRLRAESSVPVIMLTAMGEEIDRIVGLEMGADDYLAKPFNPRELLARIRAVLRRADSRPRRTNDSGGCRTVLGFAGWTLDLDRRELRDAAGVLVPLSTGEFELLAAFTQHPQRVLSRDQLLDLARGRDALPFDRAIDVQVSRLRRKIEADAREPELIKTVRGGGYLFAATVERR